MKKTIAWLNDTGMWFPIIAAILFGGFLFVSAFFHLNNFYSKSCLAAGWWWKIGGLAVMALFGFFGAKAGEGDGKYSGIVEMVLFGIGFVLGICFFAGFNFQFA